jgi:hypothetical protein
MLIHLLEAVLSGALLLGGPLVVVAAMAGLLTLIERLYCTLWETRPGRQYHVVGKRVHLVFTCVKSPNVSWCKLRQIAQFPSCSSGRVGASTSSRRCTSPPAGSMIE